PYALYAIAGASIVLGALGLVIGLRGGREAPAPIAQPAPPRPEPAIATPPPPAPREPQKIQVQIDADAPNARVVMRRRVSAAPSTTTFAPSDIVELVE